MVSEVKGWFPSGTDCSGGEGRTAYCVKVRRGQGCILCQGEERAEGSILCQCKEIRQGSILVQGEERAG